MSENKSELNITIPKDLFTPSKFLGVRISSIVLVVCEPLVLLPLTRNLFPVTEVFTFILFIVMNIVFMLWLVFPFNNKNNMYAVKLFFLTRRHSYKSISVENKLITDVDMSRRRS